jgi:hypothetical protein
VAGHVRVGWKPDDSRRRDSPRAAGRCGAAAIHQDRASFWLRVLRARFCCRPAADRGGNGSAWVIWGNKSIAVRDGETVLGRSLDATIRFDVPGVSRRHARLIVAGASVSVEDLGSQNGTYVRGEKISGRTTLEDGDELRLGPVAVFIRLVSPDNSTLPM